jgi:hypothetical protein
MKKSFAAITASVLIAALTLFVIEGVTSVVRWKQASRSLVYGIYSGLFLERASGGAGRPQPGLPQASRDQIEALLPDMIASGVGMGNVPYRELVTGRAAINETGPDGCPRWSDQRSCPGGQFCQEGLCVEVCSDICAEGARQCLSETEWQVCERGARGCLTWGEATECSPGEICTGEGVCAVCADECVEGLVYCSRTGTPLICAVGAAGCLTWIEWPACAPPQLCWEGACVDGCTNVCSAGQMRCFGADYQICMMQPAGCYGWGTPYHCPGGRSCTGAGICPSCTDVCREGDGRCDTATSAVRCRLDGTTGCWVWSPSTWRIGPPLIASTSDSGRPATGPPAG